MNSKNNPCFGCTDRVVGCHGSCNKYIQFREELTTEKTVIRNAMAEDRTWADVKVSAVKRCKTRRVRRPAK